MKNFVMFSIVCITLCICRLPVHAAPDQYPGDSSIYGVQAPLQPNVLIVIDNSGSMDDSVPADSYDPGVKYPVQNKCTVNGGTYANQACNADTVYQLTTTYDWFTRTYQNYGSYFFADVDDLSCEAPRTALQTYGISSGRRMRTSGTCRSGNDTYAVGNYINYLYTSGAEVSKMTVAKRVIKNLISTTSNVKFGLMKFRYVSGNGQGGELVSITDVPGAPGVPYISEVKKMDDLFSGSVSNRTALLAAVDSLSPSLNTPLGETLFEAGRYISGGSPAFGATTGVSGGSYTSPVDADCQKQYIVFVSDGMSNADNSSILKTGLGTCVNGDCDRDAKEPDNLNHSLDDVAKYLNTQLEHNGNKLNVITYTIGFGLDGANQDAIDLLTSASNSEHGKGGYFPANSETDLSAAFTTIMTEIFSVNSSYVAPVVPVSPQNRTYAGSRIYMGFFKPTYTAWEGNLKKYGIDTSTNIMDANGNYATWEDTDGDRFDDRIPHAPLPVDAVNGSFRTTARSFWSTAVDGGNVDVGGVGAKLQSTPSGSRNIYTMTPTGTSLISLNSTSGSSYVITPAMLGLDAADTTGGGKLINYLYGLDAYDVDGDGITSVNRDWVMGDILHSRPVIVNYASYAFSASSEAECSVNKSVIFVGSNDGMLHAFKDCDGTEAWSFVPPDILPNLSFLTAGKQTYFIDSTVSTYVYDNDGTIGTGDKVILIFGLRRGGGTAAAATTGAYYVLDVSDPASPVFLWKLSNSTPVSGSPASPVFRELAEAWSEPKIVKMRIGSPAADKIVAFFGAGYDNPNEDGRYGATQTFPATATGVAASETGSGAETSSGTYAPSNPKGRGIYAIEIAMLNNGVPTVSASASKIWGFLSGESFSFPSEIASIDSDNNGYTDLLYAVDTGGNLWRFDVGSSDTAAWTGKKLFSSNPDGASTDVGRKIFYKPSVITEPGYRMIYFGTGDREHPLNTNVVDRIYAFKDKGSTTSGKTESDLLDVTLDALQTTTVTSGTGSIADILSKLDAAFGWYIKLENTGEKVLAPPTVFNKVAYFTTYAPGPSSTDLCAAGNLGTARLYALNYKTGEAVLNYNKGNDTGTYPNIRGKYSGGGVLDRSDRVKTIGSGIPSGAVILITPGGKTKLLTGVGGAIASDNPPPGGSIVPLYWRQK